MDKQIEYLNNIIANKKNVYSGPKKLYKYRPFDEYTFDMLKNNYLYLCPAENLDDETECVTEIDLNQIYDFETNNLKRECVELIIDLIKPYTSSDNYELISQRIHQIMNPNGTVKPNYMLDLHLEFQNMFPKIDTAPFVNFIVNIPKILDQESVRSNNEHLIEMALNARKEIGVCSLCEFNDLNDMWKNYAGKHSGYCIEFSIDDYEFNDCILPVVYNDERKYNIVTELLSTNIMQMIEGFTNGEIKTEKSQFLRLFLSKHKKWSYQKEWRLIGGAGEKPRAPKIKAIYLGKNILKDNYDEMVRYCKCNNIPLISIKKKG